MLDELSPIEDYILATQHGSIKDVRYVQISRGPLDKWDLFTRQSQRNA